MTDPLSGLEDLRLGEELVTGEAVALELRPASFATRALALALDLLVLGALLVLVLWALAAVSLGVDDALGAAIGLVAMLAVIPGSVIAVETATRGRSVGKLAAGLRVVRDDGGPIRFRHALVRGLVGVVEIYLLFGSLALVCSLSNIRGKRVGDLLAGTYVIRDRAPSAIAPPPMMPPWLAGWAADADLGRLPERPAAAARRFLGRAPSLHPASRQHLARSLADQLAPHVAPPPPSGTGPEEFLAAVLAERYRRDLDRMLRQAAARAHRDARRRAASPLSSLGTGLVDGVERPRAPRER